MLLLDVIPLSLGIVKTRGGGVAFHHQVFGQGPTWSESSSSKASTASGSGVGEVGPQAQGVRCQRAATEMFSTSEDVGQSPSVSVA